VIFLTLIFAFEQYNSLSFISVFIGAAAYIFFLYLYIDIFISHCIIHAEFDFGLGANHHQFRMLDVLAD